MSASASAGGAGPASGGAVEGPLAPGEGSFPTDLERAIADLDDAAARLRAGDLDAGEAAALVERCADLAAEVGAALERKVRAAAREEAPPGQETLL